MDEPPGPPRPDASEPAGPEPAAAQETIPPPPPPPPPEVHAPPARWTLRRSVRDRKLKGVAGGIAAAADLDPTVVRLLFAVAAFSGWGIVVYIALAVVLQDETAEQPATPLSRDHRRNLRIGLAVAGIIAIGRFLDGWFFGGTMNLPFLLMLVGGAVLWARRDQAPPEPPLLPPEGGSGGAAAPGDPLSPPMWTGPVPVAPLGAGIDWRSTGRDLLRLAAAFVAVGALLALLGGAFLVVVGAVSMRLPFLPAAVAVVGLLALVVAVVRRASVAGLLVSGGVLVVAAALAVGLTSFPGGAGTRVVAVGPATPLLDRYEQSAGRLVLDLRDLTLAAGDERRVVAEVGSGQLSVIVPEALTTDVEAEVGAGTTRVFGREEGGPGVDVSGSHRGSPGAGRLRLDLRAGVGQVEVELAPEPVFDVACQVPAEVKGDGTDPVTCPHPPRLASREMSCSVILADPDGGRATGRALCRAAGGERPPKAGTFAVPCSVRPEDGQATCERMPAAQQAQLAALRDRAATTAPPTTAASGATAPTGMVCGPPDADGFSLCTPAPASTTTTAAAAAERCRVDPVTRALSDCVPA